MDISQVLTDSNQHEEIFRRLTLDALMVLAEPIREVVHAVAIPRQFDEKVLGALLDVTQEQARSLCQQLQQLAFVQSSGEDSLILFPFVRLVILQDWTHNHAKFIEYSQRLTRYYQHVCEANGGWSPLERTEVVYHSIAINENEGFMLFEREFLRAIEFAQYDRCSYLLRSIEDRRSELSNRNQLWSDFYAVILAERLEHWAETESRYKTLQASEGWSGELRAFFGSKLVEVSRKIDVSQSDQPSRITVSETADQKQNLDTSDFNIDSEIGMLQDFYRQKQNAAKTSFTLALAAGGIGFFIILAGIAGAFFLNTQIAVVTSAAGIISEVTASLFLAQNKRAEAGMDVCQKDLVKMRNLSRALRIVGTGILPSKERQKRVANILDELIGIRDNST